MVIGSDGISTHLKITASVSKILTFSKSSANNFGSCDRVEEIWGSNTSRSAILLSSCGTGSGQMFADSQILYALWLHFLFWRFVPFVPLIYTSWTTPSFTVCIVILYNVAIIWLQVHIAPAIHEHQAIKILVSSKAIYNCFDLWIFWDAVTAQ